MAVARESANAVAQLPPQSDGQEEHSARQEEAQKKKCSKAERVRPVMHDVECPGVHRALPGGQGLLASALYRHGHTRAV